MEKTRRIFLYGNSVILGTMAASLQRSSQYEIAILIPPLPGEKELAALQPDVVIFDLEGARPEAAFSLLQTYPQLMLIGISPDTNVVKMWSGKQLRELSTQDLLKMINGQVKDSTVT